MVKEAERYSTWALFITLLVMLAGVALLSVELVKRYKKRWPW